MAINSAVFVAGRYTISWNSVSLGIMEGDQQSPFIECDQKGEKVDNTDAFGKSTVEGIYQGGDWFCQFVMLEWLAGGRSALWPWHATFGTMGIIGRLYTDVAFTLLATVVAGTPAASAGSPTSITATKAIIAPQYNTRFLLGATLRKLPIRMQLFPSGAAGAELWFTMA